MARIGYGKAIHSDAECHGPSPRNQPLEFGYLLGIQGRQVDVIEAEIENIVAPETVSDAPGGTADVQLGHLLHGESATVALHWVRHGYTKSA